jgi:hypothetical protein
MTACGPGAGALDKVPLELGGNRTPSHQYGRAQALQDLLFFVSEGGEVVAILGPLNRPIDMDRSSILVFSKRRVDLLKIAQFLRFVRRTHLVPSQNLIHPEIWPL